MKKLVLVFVLGVFALNVNAQNAEKAKKLLDEVSAKVNSYENIQIEFKYQLNNKELNLGLHVNVPMTIGDGTNYTVSFNPYTSPFALDANGNIVANDNAPANGYPVESYMVLYISLRAFIWLYEEMVNPQ